MINKYKMQNKFFNLYCLFDVLKMSAFDKMSPQAKQRYQDKQVRKLVRRAYYDVPFYKERFDKAGVHPDEIRTSADLAKLPVLTKEEYRKWMLEELEKPETQYFKKTQTSGSTGIPTTNIYPPKEYAQHYMADFFGWMKGGYNPFWGKTLTRQPGDSSVGTQSIVQKFGILRRECFDTHWEREKIIEKINDYQPDFILCNSSELVYIAQYGLQEDRRIYKPQFYCPNGENIDGNTERILKKVYGDGLINLYGCTEMASFAVKSPGNTGYEIIEDLVTVNVKTEQGIQKSGEGTLLVTPLYSTQYPMLNYEIGDFVTLEYKNGYEYISKISGRKNDVFVWKSGKQTIYKRLEDINMNLKDIYQIRFIQESYEKLKIQVVKDPGTDKTQEELERYLLGLYQKEFEDGVDIVFEWLQVIPPDPNGKIRNMISRL